MNIVAHPVATEVSPVPMLASQHCQFQFADGRRCRMRPSEAHPALCTTHARAEAQALADSQIPDFSADITPPSGEFKTAIDVNRALSKVFCLLAQNRIPRRNAVALGYIAQLLLQSLPAVKEEILSGLGYHVWRERLESSLSEDDVEEETGGEEETGAPKSGTNRELEERKDRRHAAQPVPPRTAQPSPTRESREPLGTPISRLAVSEAFPRESKAAPRRSDTACREHNHALPTARQNNEEAEPGQHIRHHAENSDSPISPLPGCHSDKNKTEVAASAQTPVKRTKRQNHADSPPASPRYCYRDARGNPTVVENIKIGLL